MEENTQQPAPASTPAPTNAKLSKDERHKIMSEAAKRRWAKAKREGRTTLRAKGKATKTTRMTKSAKSALKPVQGKKKVPAPREFSSALKTAEKRLAKAILERSEAAARYAVVSAEIPSLQRLIIALKNPLGAQPEPYFTSGTYNIPTPPTLEQIVGDSQLAYQNPPPPRRTDRIENQLAQAPQAPQPVVPQIPVPQQLHPANATTGRAGGGAISVPMEEDTEDTGDENRFLNESEMRGGVWH